MNVDRAVLAFAGMMILTSLLLAWLVSPYWLLLTAFVGLNLLQAAFTGFCPAAIALRKLGLPGFECFTCLFNRPAIEKFRKHFLSSRELKAPSLHLGLQGADIRLSCINLLRQAVISFKRFSLFWTRSVDSLALSAKLK